MNTRKLVTLFVIAVLLLSVSAYPSPIQASMPAKQLPLPPRNGAWVDSVTFSARQIPDDGILALQNDELDIYAGVLTGNALFDAVKADPKLAYTQSMGSYVDLTFNPYGPTFADGRLNPFSNYKIREAVNKLINRQYIIDAIYHGQAVPKLLPISSAMADYDR